mgnify:CR=1 FL=1
MREELVKLNDWIYELYIKEFILNKKTLKTNIKEFILNKKTLKTK